MSRTPGSEEEIAAAYLAARRQDDTASGDGQSLGRYRLIEELGRGGQAVVWRAEDTALGRPVALKVIRGLGAGAHKALERFRREAAITSKLDHPAICPVYEVGFDSVPWIAMRLVEGTSLAKRIATAKTDVACDPDVAPFIGIGDETTTDGTGALEKREESDASRPSTLREVMAIVAVIEKVARALHMAHEAGVLHRDIKPGNVMVTPEGEPVLLDFGLAREDESDAPTITESGELMGTPAYMSPEQLTRQTIPVDRRSDVYSLGVTLFECLTTRRPFEHPTREALYNAILTEEAPDVRKFGPTIPKDLAVIVETTLQKNRDDRYQTAFELAEDLRRVREYQPILARPAGPLTRVKRWSQRHPGVAASLALAFLFLASGFATSLVLLHKAEKERDSRIEAERAAVQRSVEAQEQAEVAEAVADFLNTDLLGAVNPEFAGGKEWTVREILDRAAATVGSRFSDRSAVEIRIRRTLGETYRALGQYDDAIEHLEMARSLSESHFGPSTFHVAEILVELAFAKSQGKAADREAAGLCRSAYEMCLRDLGPDHEKTLGAHLAWDMFEALAIGRAAPGLTKGYLRMFASARGKKETMEEVDRHLKRRLAEIEALWRRNRRDAAFEIIRAEAAPVLKIPLLAPRVPLGLSAYALDTLYGAGLPGAAEALTLASLEMSTVNPGPTHHQTLMIKRNLARIRRQQGAIDRALQIYEEVRTARVAKWGEGHRNTLAVTRELAGVHSARKEYDRAAELLGASLVGADAAKDQHLPGVIMTMRDLAEVRIRQDRPEDAEKILLDAWKRAESSDRDASRRIIASALASLYEALKKPSDAKIWQRRREALEPKK